MPIAVALFGVRRAYLTVHFLLFRVGIHCTWTAEVDPRGTSMVEAVTVVGNALRFAGARVEDALELEL